MFKSDIEKVVGSVTHEPYIVTVAGAEIEVPRPRMRQLLLAEKHFSSLSDVSEDASYLDMVTHLAKAGRLAMVASIFLTGEEDKRVARAVEERWTVTDTVLFVQDVLMRDSEVEGFFVFTTSLKNRSLLSPTKEVETASGH